MKILHIIPSYLPAVGASGPISAVHAMHQELARRGVGITVYTTDRDGFRTISVPLHQEVVMDGVKIFYFPVTFRPWQYSYSLHRMLARKIKEFDVVHITSVFLSASALGAYYGKKFNKPYVISPRGGLMAEPLRRKNAVLKKIYIAAIEKRNLAGAAAMHFTSQQEMKEYAVARLPLRHGMMVPNCLGPEAWEETPTGIFRKRFHIASHKKLILFLGRISWKKGFDTLIPALANVLKREPDAVLVIVGPDDEGYKKKVRFLIAHFGLQDKVIFTGALLGKEKSAACRESDVFVLPSYAENFGMAVAEAMALRLPVVVTKAVGIAPLIEKAGAGAVIDKSESQLARAILDILNDPDLARKMGARGEELVKNECSALHVAEAMAREYTHIIDDYRRR